MTTAHHLAFTQSIVETRGRVTTKTGGASSSFGPNARRYRRDTTSSHTRADGNASALRLDIKTTPTKKKNVSTSASSSSSSSSSSGTGAVKVTNNSEDAPPTPTPAPSRGNAIVVGAGPAGALTAMTLARAGFQVDVLAKRTVVAITFTRVGEHGRSFLEDL